MPSAVLPVPGRSISAAPKWKSEPFRRFRPHVALGYQDELLRLARSIETMGHDEADRELSAAVENAERLRSRYESLGLTRRGTPSDSSVGDLAPCVVGSPCARVGRPDRRRGATLTGTGNHIQRSPRLKRRQFVVRFAFARNAQLSQPSAIRFIRRLERRGVHTLFADGPELAERLRANGPAGVGPQLELIEQGARDSGTGLLLQDIWRYARHFWSIPYQSTPGRNMFYLVRDSAAAGRPLIGHRGAGQYRPGARSAR